MNDKKTLIIDARNGNQFIGLGIKAQDQLKLGTYKLSVMSEGMGNFSKDDIYYKTDSAHTGTVIITDLLIEGKPIIRGSFSFKAIDSLSQNKVVVSNGFFQVLLKDY